MNEITMKFREGNRYGSISFSTKHPADYYSGRNFSFRDTFLHEEYIYKMFRYLAWMDDLDLLPSGSNYSVPALAHKQPCDHRCHPIGFDHTSMWRKKGDRHPLLVITEPYDLPRDEERFVWDLICKDFGLEYKIFEPSEKSLHYPGRTYMIYWWCPKYFEWSDNLLNYRTDSEVYNQCKRDERCTKKTVNA